MKKVIVDIASFGQTALKKALKENKLNIIGVTVSPDVQNYEDLAVFNLEDIRTVGDVPVYTGAQRPLLNAEYVADKKCVKIEKTHEFADGHAVNFIIENADEELEIICLGTLSNVALAILKDEEKMKKVGRIFVAGGSLLGYQSTTETAYHNILADVEAADTVFKSGIPITLVPYGEIDDLPSAVFAVACGCDYSSWDAFVTIDTSIGMTRGQTVIDTVGYNLITMEKTPGIRQTVVTKLGKGE